MASVTLRTLADVHRRRLATQRLASAGLPRGADVVRLLTCVQSQVAPLGMWSLGMRMRPRTTYGGVRAEQLAGGWVRTHILRPTWHYVAPEDLRWIQRLTGPKVESSLAGRHRGLELDDSTVGRALEALCQVLAGPRPMTRRELTAEFAARGLAANGEQMAHQLLIAEVRSVICSGPPRGAEHTYVLVDETLPTSPSDRLDGESAQRELVRRFVAGHGPASDRDLLRWSTLTLTEIRACVADLAGELDSVEVEGHTLWFDPAVPARTTRPHPAYLVPTFDEVSLTYAQTGFPRRNPKATRQRPLSEVAGGIVVLDGEDVAAWKRTVSRSAVRVTVSSDVPLRGNDRDAVAKAADRLARFLELPLELEVKRAPDDDRSTGGAARSPASGFRRP
jgi:hypothetical protein